MFKKALVIFVVTMKDKNYRNENDEQILLDNTINNCRIVKINYVYTSAL